MLSKFQNGETCHVNFSAFTVTTKQAECVEIHSSWNFNSNDNNIITAHGGCLGVFASTRFTSPEMAQYFQALDFTAAEGSKELPSGIIKGKAISTDALFFNGTHCVRGVPYRADRTLWVQVGQQTIEAYGVPAIRVCHETVPQVSNEALAPLATSLILMVLSMFGWRLSATG